MACNNVISRVRAGLGKVLPRVETLTLTNNDLSSLGALTALGELPRLLHLSLVGNPVQKLPNYRAYVIFKCKNLEVLDYCLIKRQERWQAEQIFAGDEGAALLKSVELLDNGSILTNESSIEANAAKSGKRARQNEADQELQTRIISAIENASTLEHVSRLQNALQEGADHSKVLELLQEIEADNSDVKKSKI